ncbi:MAG: glycosyltransferase [Myxococcota bacterium]|jgi:glycosyltransferase involved in cell wall biosynthesis
MRLRHALLCHTVPLDESGGGQRAAQLARELASRGVAVDYVALTRRFDFERDRPADSTVSWPGVTAHLLAELGPGQLEALVTAGSLVIVDAPHPAFAPVFQLARARGAPTVFELIDDWDTSLGADWYDAAFQRRLVREATLVAGSARSLVEQLRALGRSDSHYVPNAADGRLFDASRAWPRPAAFEPGRRALVYVGSLTGDWLGWAYLTQAARALPEARLYLVGDAPRAVTSLARLYPNLRFLGLRPIEEVPAYLAHADVTLLPFLPGRVSDAVSPIKVFEYLAMGKRVVATPLPELEGLPNITVAATSDAFAQACVQAPPAGPEGVTFASSHTWARRVDYLLGALGLEA